MCIVMPITLYPAGLSMSKTFIAFIILLLTTHDMCATQTYLQALQASFLEDATHVCPPTASVVLGCINSCGHRTDCCSGNVEQINAFCSSSFQEAQRFKEDWQGAIKPEFPCSKEPTILMIQKQMLPGKKDPSNEQGIFVCKPKKRHPISSILTALTICSLAPRIDGSYDRHAPLIPPCQSRCETYQKPAFNRSEYQSPVSRKPTVGKRQYR